MKNHLTILIFIVSMFSIHLSWSQDVNLLSQSDVDAFDPSITSITGYLRIESTDIFDLSNLSNITTVGGDLNIRSNVVLMNLDGLSNLTSVGGNLYFYFNKALTNLDGLSNIVTANENLNIYDNIALTNLDGLSNITTVNGNLQISSNIALMNFDGLSNITSVSGDLYFSYNESLTNFDGLSNITIVNGDFYIYNNENLMNIDGLSNVTTVYGGLDIINNTALTNVDGLSNLTTVIGNLRISGNTVLKDLDGLFNVISLGENLDIYDNPELWDCCGIKHLIEIEGAVFGGITIYGNPSDCSNKQEILGSKCVMTVHIITNPPCIDESNGSLQIFITDYKDTPFTYSWTRQEDGVMGSGVSSIDYFSIDNLEAGTYNITVTSPRPDTVINENVILTQIVGSVFEIIELTTTNSSNGYNNGSINITISGGTPPYSIDWYGQSSGSQSGINGVDIIIPLLTQGEYNITVFDDAGNQQSVAVSLLDETIPIFPCKEPLDIVILNDVSSSVNAIEYAESKQFFVDFLNEVNIGLGVDDSRAAIIEWSSADEQGIAIPITGETTNLQNYINNTRLFDNGTALNEAMITGEAYLSNVARTDVAKVLILSTDGSVGQISPSIVALADQFKADGYHIVTIAFDIAFSSPLTRELLRKVASIDQLAPGALAYSDLDEELAKKIVNLYLCPIDPGSSATAYFNRDGALDIIDFVPIGDCPTPEFVELTFTIEALRELSLPSGIPVSFYHNNPAIFGANHILTWVIPCAIPAGEIDTFTVILPITTATNVFALLNDDGSTSPPISLPVTGIEELAYSNNVDNESICADTIVTLQVLKSTTTPIPICNNTVIYTIDVCNISGFDAFGVMITDEAPSGFVLYDMTINDNGCGIDQGGIYDIPKGCCISLTLSYDASLAANGYYGNQDVLLDGPDNQEYINFDGFTTTDEDVIIDGTIDCPSTTIDFSKSVNITESCDDAFVVYQFTIDNQSNVPILGMSFSDILPDPVTWTFEPYGMEGIKISNANLNGPNANFIIDEVAANTMASFYIDAYVGDWLVDGLLDNEALLEHVPDLDNGGFKSITSNTVNTTISAAPEVNIVDTILIVLSATSVSLEAIVNGAADITWTSSGNGSFDDDMIDTPVYTLGSEDIDNGQVGLFVSLSSDCGESGKNVTVLIIPCELRIDKELLSDCDDNGTPNDPMDDFFMFSFNVSGFGTGAMDSYNLTDGSITYGPYLYGIEESIILRANADEIELIFSDIDDANCKDTIYVKQENCSCGIDMLFDESGPLCDNDVLGKLMIVSELSNMVSYEYSFDSISYQSMLFVDDTCRIEDLTIGIYQLYFRQFDNVSCNTEYIFEIVGPPIFDIDLGGDQTILLAEEVQLHLTSNVDLVSLDWAWNNAYEFTCINCPDPVTSPLATTSFSLEIINDDGCRASDEVLVTVVDDRELVIPNIFFPIGEENNSSWDVYIPDGYMIISCEIYDRWGGRLFKVENTHMLTWNGEYKGVSVQPGVYVYSITYMDYNGIKRNKVGDLTVIH